MEGVLGFLTGLLARLGLLFAVPVAMALLLGVIALVMKLVRAAQPQPALAGAPTASWLSFDPEAAYAPGHTFLRAAGARLRIGLDDLALRLLPGAEVRGPDAGQELQAGDPLAVLRLGALEVPIPSPVPGKIVARNEARDLRSAGWLVEIEPVGEAHRSLPKGEAARAWLTQEAGRLVSFAERELGIAAADGGEVTIRSLDSVPEEKWRALLKEFLKSEARRG
ncbi:MAG: hypothetical protein HY901_30990 [Deltaproteobacteria bacterium]|nr:hypothetical protein [Deltaproteobacteria bacterium]